MHRNRRNISDGLHIPDLTEQLFFRENAVRILRKEGQQIELFRCKLLLLSVHPHAACRLVNLDAADLHNIILFLAVSDQTVVPCQMRFHARNQLTRRKWLRHIIIRTKAEVKDGKVLGVTLENVPAFLYKPNQKVVIDGKEITFDISFGGSFFALVDTDKLGLVDEINEKTVPYLTQLGMKLLHTINKEIKVQHPRLDITSVDLIEFYGHNVSPDANKRNVVIFGEGSADRSPCGTGTSAKLGTLYAKGELKVGEPFIYESFMGTKFKGVIEKEVDECGYKAVIPLITGTAYLTGEATYAIDPIDPLKYGFIVG